MEYCCEHFKNAVDEQTIKLIDQYQDIDDRGDWNSTMTKIEKGYYIIDQYKDGELALEDHPADPIITLSFCPWCGAKLNYGNNWYRYCQYCGMKQTGSSICWHFFPHAKKYDEKTGMIISK